MSKIEIIETFITTLNRKRKLRIYLPKNYENSQENYSVLYMHDGQNLFCDQDAAYGTSWKVQEAVDEFYEKYKKSLIVVGIDNGQENRFNEYSPWESKKLGKYIPELKMNVSGGEGEQYLDWLVKILIPFINKKYRTNQINYLAGSSMGANISLYGGIKYPQTFKKIGCLSPAFWFSLPEFIILIKENDLRGLEVYLDIGTKESRQLSNPELRYTKKISKLLKNKCRNLKLIIEKNAFHREADWKRRFPGFLEWLLND
ncbi:MAG: alpha/beta hydrolase-fold protein [Bacilli bacterium]|nr:alpha/beta hydrolase-fold protein [Bacilli bacterium]